MDSLKKYTQNTDCISVELRYKGNSDKCIQDLLEILYKIGGNDPTINFNNSDFIVIISSILYDTTIFTPHDGRGNINGIAREELLPNGIYRKLLVYLIINIEKLEQDKLDILIRLFTALEENNITGFMYIPFQGRSYTPILNILRRYNVQANNGWYIEHPKKPERRLIICNTTLITLIQSLLH
jgi:hypothetical protein